MFFLCLHCLIMSPLWYAWLWRNRFKQLLLPKSIRHSDRDSAQCCFYHDIGAHLTFHLIRFFLLMKFTRFILFLLWFLCSVLTLSRTSFLTLHISPSSSPHKRQQNSLTWRHCWGGDDSLMSWRTQRRYFKSSGVCVLLVKCIGFNYCTVLATVEDIAPWE